MKKALLYKKNSSSKFWRIETSENMFVVNYGKTNLAGKYQIKEFNSEQNCLKEAQKQINSKLKNKYFEFNFDYNNHLYFDDEDYNLSKLTSHPNFVKNFTDEFYYDCVEEEAPFGSDEGSDALTELQEAVRKKTSLDFSLFPKHIIERLWDMKYIEVDSLNESEIKKALESDLKYDLSQSDMVTYAIAFGQIKITGTVNPDLKERAIKAIKRIILVAKLEGYSDAESTIANQMIKDLTTFF